MELIAKITDEDIGEKFTGINNPKTRIAVRTILSDENGKIAILNKQAKNEFKLVGGGVEEGESLDEALRREILEEAGCEVKIISYLGILEEFRSKENFYQKSHIYITKVSKDTKKLHLTKKEKEEGARLCWFKPEEALEIMQKSYDKLLPSKYSDLYATNFIVKRDYTILDYYIRKILNK